MSLLIKNWPDHFQAACCLNFDDLSPFKFRQYDLGGDINGELIKQQEILLSSYPLKITHFMVPKINFFLPINNRIAHIVNFSTNQFSITNPMNIKWVAYIKELLLSNQIEIAMHGYTHYNHHFIKKHQEFLYDDYQNIRYKLLKSKKLFEDIGINIYGFRPPGWGIDRNFKLLEVIKEIGFFDYIAASSLDGGLNYHSQKVSNEMPDWFDNLLNIPQNLELDLPYETLINNINELIIKNGLISIKGHFCNIDWMQNKFKRENYDKLNNILAYMKDKNIWYATFKEVADYYKIISKSKIIKVQENSQEYIRVELPNKIKGLTIVLGEDSLDYNREHITIKTDRISVKNGSQLEICFDTFSDQFIIEIT